MKKRTPKFEIEDRVYFMANNEVKSDKITGILLRPSGFSYTFEFTNNHTVGFSHREELLYKSKEDLLASL